MSAAVMYLDSAVVDNEVGERIRQRRTRMGISVRDLAERAGVDRGQLGKLEKGEAQSRATTVALIETALDQLEQELGMDAPDVRPDDVVEFRVAGNFGVDVVVRGPVRDMEALEDSVARLISKMSGASKRTGE